MKVHELIDRLGKMPSEAEVLVGPRDGEKNPEWWNVDWVLAPSYYHPGPDVSAILSSVCLVTGEKQQHYPMKARRGH